MEKRYYSRCMYGNYIQSDFKASGSVLKKSGTSYRFKSFIALVALFLASMLIFGGCKPKQVIVEKEKYIYVTKDSIVNRDSTVYVPVEVYKDYSLDTLVLKTSLAESKSWLDTNSLYLVGEIRNLKALQIKYVEVDKWHTKDSIVEKPVPYPVVEVKTKTPTWAWWTLFICIGLLVYVGVRLYLKFKPI